MMNSIVSVFLCIGCILFIPDDVFGSGEGEGRGNEGLPNHPNYTPYLGGVWGQYPGHENIEVEKLRARFQQMPGLDIPDPDDALPNLEVQTPPFDPSVPTVFQDYIPQIPIVSQPYNEYSTFETSLPTSTSGDTNMVQLSPIWAHSDLDTGYEERPDYEWTSTGFQQYELSDEGYPQRTSQHAGSSSGHPERLFEQGGSSSNPQNESLLPQYDQQGNLIGSLTEQQQQMLWYNEDFLAAQEQHSLDYDEEEQANQMIGYGDRDEQDQEGQMEETRQGEEEDLDIDAIDTLLDQDLAAHQQPGGQPPHGVTSSRQYLDDFNTFGEKNEIMPYEVKRLRKPSSCSISLSVLTKKHGLIVNEDGKIIYPTVLDYVQIKEGESVIVHCVNSKIAFFAGRSGKGRGKHKNNMKITCYDGKLIYDGTNAVRDVSRDDLECDRVPQVKMEMVSNSKACNDKEQYRYYQVGFEILKTFNILYTICVNIKTMETAYVKNHLSRRIKGQEIFDFTPEETFFQYGDNDLFVGGEVGEKNHYDPVNVWEKLQLQLGSDAICLKLFKSDPRQQKTYSLVPGFLSSPTYLVYRSEQFAAYLHGNVKPMWSNIYDNNWTAVNKAISNLAAGKSGHINIYSGTSGQQTHKNIEGRYVSLNLGYLNTKRLQFIPQIFWKMVHHAILRECLIIIGHNTTLDVRKKACEDTTDQIPWLFDALKPGKENGTTYACSCNGYRDLLSEALPSIDFDTVLVS